MRSKAYSRRSVGRRGVSNETGRARRDRRATKNDGLRPRKTEAGFSRKILTRLVRLATGRTRSLILTHDNPDPDAMAAAAGMAYLYGALAGLEESRLAYGGIIGRAENRALVKHLKLPMIPISRLRIEDFDLVTLVDTQHAAGNHSLPRSRPPDVVIDHHPLRAGNHRATLGFVSDDYGATSSIVTALIRMADLALEPVLATALFYGVKSDTQALGRGTKPADTEVYRWLLHRADPLLLAKIEHPQVPLSYFQAYHTAFERARIYDNVIMVDLGAVYTPDIVPEIAERLLSLEQVRWSVAAGTFENELYVSVRTNDRRRNAGRQIAELTRDLGGSAGGHGSMAGARVPLTGRSCAEIKALREEMMSRFRGSLGVDRTEGRSILD